MSAWHSLAHAESAATGQPARSCPHFQVHVPVREADCRQLQSALDPGVRLWPGLPGRGVRGRREPALAGGASGGGALLLPGWRRGSQWAGRGCSRSTAASALLA